MRKDAHQLSHPRLSTTAVSSPTRTSEPVSAKQAKPVKLPQHHLSITLTPRIQVPPNRPSVPLPQAKVSQEHSLLSASIPGEDKAAFFQPPRERKSFRFPGEEGRGEQLSGSQIAVRR